MVKRGEALNDGLPRDNVVQDDQILCGVGQMSLDPLRRERVLKCLCYHGMDLCLGCRETPFRHYPTDQRSQKHALGEKISGYYVEEFGFERPEDHPNGLEMDPYDPYSIYVAALNGTEEVIGTARLVLHSEHGLPIEDTGCTLQYSGKRPPPECTAEVS